MKEIVVNNKIVKLYDSIDELPILNFQKYNKCLLIDSSVGSDIDDIDRHITQIAKYINAGHKDKALQELQNMRQNMYMVNTQISPKYLAFAALIHSVDGKELKDLSDENLKKVLEQIKEVTHFKLISLLMGIKKKVTKELEAYFPENFISVKEKEVYDKIKERTLLLLESITDDKDNTAQIEAIDAIFLSAQNPKIFYGSKSAEIEFDKQFESACVLISQKAGMNAREMTVLQFYSALDIIKQQADAEAKALKKHNNYGR